MSSEEEKINQTKPLTQEEQINDYKVMVKHRLMTGYYGLAKTFWLFWFIPILLLNIWEALSGSTGTILRIDIATLVWSAFCLFFVSKTQGRQVWKVIALIVIACDVTLSALALIAFFL